MICLTNKKKFKRRPYRWAIAVLCLLASANAQTASDKVRGMTVSCPTDGSEWGSDAMVHTMAELKEMGVTWISIHPYAHLRNDGSLRSYFPNDPNNPPRYLTRPIAEAHRLGLKIMIKPHISYWGSFPWRGAIEFQQEEEWERFFANYSEWITALAQICHQADAFVVGTELDRTVHFAGQWRHIIATVRTHFDGPITYAANWTDYERVPFWDALDVIGIQAYFPLLDEGDDPSAASLDASWGKIAARLRNFSEKQGKHVLFTEMGYNLSAKAPYEPWEYEVGGANAEAIQTRCLDAALKAIKNESRIVGSFLWKWFPGQRPPRNFAQSTPAMRRVIAHWWSLPP